MKEHNKRNLYPNSVEDTIEDELKLAKYQIVNSENRFDYIRWQIGVWNDKRVKEIGKTAMVQLIHNNNQLEIH